MAQNINSVALTGNLTRDPELREASGDVTVCSMRLAVNGRRKSGGNWVDDVNYFDVTVFGAMAKNCAEYLAKGRPVAVQGRLDWREWTTQEGAKRQAVQIIANTVQFLSSGQGQQSRPQDEYAPSDTGGGEDDIPF